LKFKKTPKFHNSEEQQKIDRKGLTAVLEKKTKILVFFAILYGLVFINYIDIIVPGGDVYGYHFWLVLMYFLPFVGFLISDLRNWRLMLGLGFIVSLMNDVFYHLIRYLVGFNVNLSEYYSLWLIPQNATLFQLNLGFVNIPVQSWMMAASIYLRFAVVFIVLKDWSIPFSLQLPTFLTLKRQKIVNLEVFVETEPEAPEIYA
jgi:hypothetical protein